MSGEYEDLPPPQPEILAAFLAALRSDCPQKAETAFSALFADLFVCRKVLGELPGRCVYLAERVGLKYDGLPVRIDIDFNLEAGEVRRISIARLDAKEWT